jgi:hypothetical protein
VVPARPPHRPRLGSASSFLAAFLLLSGAPRLECDAARLVALVPHVAFPAQLTAALCARACNPCTIGMAFNLARSVGVTGLAQKNGPTDRHSHSKSWANGLWCGCADLTAPVPLPGSAAACRTASSSRSHAGLGRVAWPAAPGRERRYGPSGLPENPYSEAYMYRWPRVWVNPAAAGAAARASSFSPQVNLTGLAQTLGRREASVSIT